MNIIFDWDGTIARSDAVRETLKKRSNSFDSMSSQEWLSQPWLADTQKEIFNKMHDKVISQNEFMQPGEIQDLYHKIMESDSFRENYNSTVKELKNKIFYNGMEEAIEKLAKDEDNNLILVSALCKGIIFHSLEYLGMKKYFKGGVYVNTSNRKYSKIDLAKMAFNNVRAEGIKCLVGDKEIDGLAAKKIHSLWIYPTWGKYGLKYTETADYSVDTSEELIKIIKSL